MAFEFPAYHHPDFTQPALLNAPDARWEAAEKDGVAPEEYHSTSMYPEYFKIDGKWTPGRGEPHGQLRGAGGRRHASPWWRAAT